MRNTVSSVDAVVDAVSTLRAERGRVDALVDDWLQDQGIEPSFQKFRDAFDDRLTGAEDITFILPRHLPTPRVESAVMANTASMLGGRLEGYDAATRVLPWPADAMYGGGIEKRSYTYPVVLDNGTYEEELGAPRDGRTVGSQPVTADEATRDRFADWYDADLGAVDELDTFYDRITDTPTTDDYAALQNDVLNILLDGGYRPDTVKLVEDHSVRTLNDRDGDYRDDAGPVADDRVREDGMFAAQEAYQFCVYLRALTGDAVDVVRDGVPPLDKFYPEESKELVKDVTDALALDGIPIADLGAFDDAVPGAVEEELRDTRLGKPVRGGAPEYQEATLRVAPLLPATAYEEAVTLAVEPRDDLGGYARDVTMQVYDEVVDDA